MKGTEVPPSERVLRAGQLARRADVSVETLRYYERLHILAEPTRTAGGQRQYPAAALDTMRTVRTLQRLGFSLDVIGSLLSVVERRSTDKELRQHLVDEVNERIADLNVLRTTLAPESGGLPTRLLSQRDSA